METTAARLHHVISQLGKKAKSFADATKIPLSTVYALLADKHRPQSDNLEKIKAAFPEVNLDWLTTGVGSVFLEEKKPVSSRVEKTAAARAALAAGAAARGVSEIVFVSEVAEAGYLAGWRDPEYMAALPVFQMPGLNLGPGRHYAFPVQGDSMYGTISAGDLFVGQLVEDGYAVRPGEIYAVMLPDGMVIKRVRFAENHEDLSLHSDNPLYDAYAVRKADVIAMFRRVLVFDFSSTHRGHGAGVLDRAVRQLGELSEQLQLQAQQAA